MFAEGKPPGSVPMLRLPNGSFIKQSIAIIDYLEDICAHPDPAQPWQMDLASSAGRKTDMRGSTPEERARHRDMLLLADDTTNFFGFACHKGTALFVPLETTHAFTAKLALETCNKNLRLLDRYYAEDAGKETEKPISVVDCVLFSTLQFARDLYNLDLLDDAELSHLQKFYLDFGKRDSAQTGDNFYPAELQKLASQWLPVE
jgi:glutathione S-transferase